MTEDKSIENMSFEAALGQLESIVRQIDSGSSSLEDSIAAYEHGMKLKSHCEAKLKEAKLKIEKIVATSDGIKTESVEL